MNSILNLPGSTIVTYLLNIAICIFAGYFFVQSMEYIGTTEHWRFTFSLIGFILLLSTLSIMIIGSLLKFNHRKQDSGQSSA